ncbi:hypothetical protein FACS1894113_5100 [Alphaproteobacteria bacterium]|nr:hypothetical protein FACS1894113_5100 [Alphaproteobacteria bacterium]
MQPVIEICSVTSPDKNLRFESKAEYIIVKDVELPVEVEYIACICDNHEKVPKDIQLELLQMSKSIYDGNDIAINSYKTLSIS